MSQQSVYLKVHGETPFKILILSMQRNPGAEASESAGTGTTGIFGSVTGNNVAGNVG